MNYFFNDNKNTYITTIDSNIKSFKIQMLAVNEIYGVHFYKFDGHYCSADYCYNEALKGSGSFFISKCYSNKAEQSTVFMFFLIKS